MKTIDTVSEFEERSTLIECEWCRTVEFMAVRPQGATAFRLRCTRCGRFAHLVVEERKPERVFVPGPTPAPEPGTDCSCWFGKNKNAGSHPEGFHCVWCENTGTVK